MAETEYIVDGKVTSGIFPKNCVYTDPREPDLEASMGKRLKYVQEDFEVGKGVENPCWSCLYNGGICKSARAKYKENGKEFLIQPKVENPILT